MELNEKASNAQLARNFIIALPKELSFEENKKLITDFIQENFVSKGMIADLAIHDRNDQPIGRLVLARTISLCRRAPRRNKMLVALALSLTAASVDGRASCRERV